ncbi:MAG: hypothetical protein HQ565_09645 [Bacteroidetes bacterium]|nr:hypothetical protein [Bacteroidota bacterium]
MKKLVLFLLIGSFIITLSSAQEPQATVTPKLKNWSIGLHMGWIPGGPSKRIEEHMSNNGFDRQSSRGWFGGSGRDYPFSDRFLPSLMLSVKYYLKPKLAIGMVGGILHLGSTHGNIGDYVHVENKLSYFAAVISYNYYDIVRIGVGPAVYFTRTWEEGFNIEGSLAAYEHTKLGFVIDFGLRIPKKTRCFFELNIQYRYVGKLNIGPFNLDSYNPELPQASVSFNHVMISQGFGVRF